MTRDLYVAKAALDEGCICVGYRTRHLHLRNDSIALIAQLENTITHVIMFCIYVR
jgi:hypothetical protein